MGFLGFLGTPLGYVLKWMYDFLGSYGWALVVFTILIRLLSFPLQPDDRTLSPCKWTSHTMESPFCR